MVLRIDHCAANADGEWLDFPPYAGISIPENESNVLFDFTTDYGRGKRLFHLTLEPSNFAVLARIMMQADREAATAAFSDALCRAYPLPQEDEEDDD